MTHEFERHNDDEIKSYIEKEKERPFRIPGNPPLYIGAALLLLLFGVCFFPEYFTKMDPHGLERSQFVFIDGKLNMFAPPYGPNKNWPWGTDVLGRDMMSLILYGAGMTIFSALIITAVRTVIALIVGIFSAYGFRMAKDGIRIFSSIFAAFPLTMVVLLIISTGVELGPKILDGGYAVGMPVILAASLLGWGRLSALISEKTSEILQMDFIEGERAIGKGKLKIALENLIPHLLPQLTVLAFLEVSSVLLLLCQIGFFSILLNGGFSDGEGGFLLPPGMDWASLLSVAPKFIIGGKYWLVFFPAAAFAYGIFAFNLVGEGMGIALERNGSKIISQIRNLPSFVSPFRYVYEIRNFKEHKTVVIEKTLGLLIILALLLWPANKGSFQISYGEMLPDITKWSSDILEGRMTGSGVNKSIADELAADMKENRIKPYGDDFVQEYKVNGFKWTGKASVKVNSSLEGEEELIYRKDFQMTGPGVLKGDFQVANLGNLSYESIRAVAYEDPEIHNKFVLVDLRGMSPWNLKGTLNLLNDMKPVKGILYVTEDRVGPLPEKTGMDRIGGVHSGIPNLRLTAAAGDRLKRLNEFTISVDIEPTVFQDSLGFNVVGKVEGTGKDIIIVGTTYDGPGFDEGTKYPAASEVASMALLKAAYKEMAKHEGTLKKTILFAFWDGSYSRDRGSLRFIERYGEQKKQLKFPEKLGENASGEPGNGQGNLLYIDIGGIGRGNPKEIIFDTSGALPRDQFAMEFIKELRSSRIKGKPELVDSKLTSSEQLDFSMKNVNVIEFAQTDTTIAATPDDTMEKLNGKAIENFGNFFLNELLNFAEREN